MTSIIFLIFIVLLVVMFSFSLYMRAHFRGRKYLFLSGMSIVLWLIFAYFEISSASIEAKSFWTSLSWLGAGGVSVGFFFFIVEFLLGKSVGRYQSIVVFSAFAIGPALLGITNPWHGIFFGDNTELITTSGHSFVVYDRQPIWYIYSASVHIFIISTLAIMLFGLFKADKIYKPQIGAMLLAGAVPLAFNISYIVFDLRIIGFNFAPFSFVLSYALFAGITFLGRALDVESIGADILFHNSKRPIVIFDDLHNNFFPNRAFKSMLSLENVSLSSISSMLIGTFNTNDSAEIKIDKSVYLVNHTIIESAITIGNKKNVVGHIYMFIDITEQKSTEKRLRSMSEKDWLTKVSSRGHFMETLEDAAGKQAIGIFVIDLDLFKNINDTFGHDAGDAVLEKVGAELISIAGGWKHVGRAGGDEFIIFKVLDSESSLDTVASCICERMRNIPHHSSSECFTVTVCVGASLLHQNDDIESALKKADLALYDAKNGGRNNFAVYKLVNQL